jgi:polyphosphate kinase
MEAAAVEHEMGVGANLDDKALRRCTQNRELSWLRFNERVLEEANSQDTPLFERLFYISIFTSNLDEFFMVRVGSFQELARSKTSFTDSKTGWGAQEVLDKVFAAVSHLYPQRDDAYMRVESELGRIGIERRMPQELSASEDAQLLTLFKNEIQPLLAPQVIDKTHPFPHLENKHLIIALSLEGKGGRMFGMIPVPLGAQRLHMLPGGGFILLEDILLHFAQRIFKKYAILEKAVICVTRNADIDTVDERFDDDEDFRDHMSKMVKRRRRLAPVRLEIQAAPEATLKRIPDYLCKHLGIDAAQVFTCTSPLDISFHSKLRSCAPPETAAANSFGAFEPVTPPSSLSAEGMFKRIRQGDVLLFHPYESLQPYLTLIKEASEDADVISIQITLYRLAETSRLAEHLIAATENGKQVVVFIELRARMDEENNIGWAKRLEEAGCAVFYGQLGYKMHAKITLITRREGAKLAHYAHIGTGNYNEKSARGYADLSLMTADAGICADAITFFQNMLVGAVEESYPTLLVAPQDFKPRLLELIRREAALGRDGRIIIKCNSLTDKAVIQELVKASMAGTRVDLILRGICCLVPGIKKYTENIHIRSIVGRFLEHSRILCFGTGEGCDLYVGSGDMMTRNTTRRVELFAPVRDPHLKARVKGILDTELHDNVKARILTSNGRYIRSERNGQRIDSQAIFMQEALKEGQDPAQSTALAFRPSKKPGILERIRAFLRL